MVGEPLPFRLALVLPRPLVVPESAPSRDRPNASTAGRAHGGRRTIAATLALGAVTEPHGVHRLLAASAADPARPRLGTVVPVCSRPQRRGLGTPRLRVAHAVAPVGGPTLPSGPAGRRAARAPGAGEEDRKRWLAPPTFPCRVRARRYSLGAVAEARAGAPGGEGGVEKTYIGPPTLLHLGVRIRLGVALQSARNLTSRRVGPCLTLLSETTHESTD
jgi:hypothetical protein